MITGVERKVDTTIGTRSFTKGVLLMKPSDWQLRTIAYNSETGHREQNVCWLQESTGRVSNVHCMFLEMLGSKQLIHCLWILVIPGNVVELRNICSIMAESKSKIFDIITLL